MTQKQIFMNGEGNEYFHRNRAASENADVAKAIQFYSSYIKAGSKVLEIGCCNGANLSGLQSLVGCECFGIDPSEEAIADGRRRFPSLWLSAGTADELPFAPGEFDFVLFGFCLYLVDRELLPRTVAEGDRVLRSGGFLGITDFDAATPTVHRYKHASGVSTYKMDYSRLFTAYPHYSLVSKISYSHAADVFHPDPNERLASTVLFKDTEHAYAVGER